MEEDPIVRSETPRGFEPAFSSFTTIAHYYGDTVRELLLAGAILMLLSSPLYANVLTAEFPLEVLGAIIAVCFAALTSPQKKWVMIGNAIITGVALVIFQSWAVLDLDLSNPIAFVLREALAIVALFALYFSVKTVRAMMLHQIGVQTFEQELADEAEYVDPYKDDGEGMD